MEKQRNLLISWPVIVIICLIVGGALAWEYGSRQIEREFPSLSCEQQEKVRELNEAFNRGELITGTVFLIGERSIAVLGPNKKDGMVELLWPGSGWISWDILVKGIHEVYPPGISGQLAKERAYLLDLFVQQKMAPRDWKDQLK